METKIEKLTAADIRACAAGLRDGMGAHADYCAAIMEQLANNIAAAEQAQQSKTVTLEQLVSNLKAGEGGDAISAAMDQACADMELGRRMREQAQQADHIVEATEMAQQAEPVNQQLLAAAMLAKSKIEQDRKALHECHAHPRTGLVTDGPGLLALQEYDAVLVKLNVSIAAAKFMDGREVDQEKLAAIGDLPCGKQAEPVAAQCRFEGKEEWSPCTLAHHLLVQAHPKEWPHYETRALYAQPPAVAVAVPDEVVKDAARYRWLRQDESEFSSMAPAELDAAIDKAIAAAQKGGA